MYIEDDNKTQKNVDKDAKIDGSSVSDNYINSSKNINDKETRKISTDGLFKCKKNLWMFIPTNK